MIDIDEEGILILKNETLISDDILDKIKKIVIDKSFQGIWLNNVFKNKKKITKNLINLVELDFSNSTLNKINCYSLCSVIQLYIIYKLFKNYIVV